jgi:hypothetical protein
MAQRLILLSDDDRIDLRNKKILSDLRKTYGNTTQILVSNEELCELAAVCAKLPRYKDPKKARAELHSAAIDEVADVMIILDHVINIFQLKDEEIRKRIGGKLDRIVRWLAESSDQEQTTVDREVREGVNPQPKKKSAEKPQEQPREGSVHLNCAGCAHVGEFQQLKIGGRCSTCAQNNWSLWESKEAPGVGNGYRVRHQADHEPGKPLTWEEFVIMQLRAEKKGLLFPDEAYIVLKSNRWSNLKRGEPINMLDETSYGLCWEAVWR